jgi:hypothetical protein
MKKSILTLFVCLLMAGTTQAGWYVCYNYKGKIGNRPIRLSLQLLRGFGEDKEAITVKGVYMFDNVNEPIVLNGILNEKTHIVLKETVNNQPNAMMDFLFYGNKIKGTWMNLKNMQPEALELEKTGELIDTLAANKVATIDIMQSASLKDKYLVGVYSKKANTDKAVMNKLKIIDKHTNKVSQEIDLSKVKTASGNVWTIIYGNTLVDDIDNDGKPDITVWNDIGKRGGYLYIQYDAKKQEYILNPVPEADEITPAKNK